MRCLRLLRLSLLFPAVICTVTGHSQSPHTATVPPQALPALSPLAQNQLAQTAIVFPQEPTANPDPKIRPLIAEAKSELAKAMQTIRTASPPCLTMRTYRFTREADPKLERESTCEPAREYSLKRSEQLPR